MWQWLIYNCWKQATFNEFHGNLCNIAPIMNLRVQNEEMYGKAIPTNTSKIHVDRWRYSDAESRHNLTNVNFLLLVYTCALRPMINLVYVIAKHNSMTDCDFVEYWSSHVNSMHEKVPVFASGKFCFTCHVVFWFSLVVVYSSRMSGERSMAPSFMMLLSLLRDQITDWSQM